MKKQNAPPPPPPREPSVVKQDLRGASPQEAFEYGKKEHRTTLVRLDRKPNAERDDPGQR